MATKKAESHAPVDDTLAAESTPVLKVEALALDEPHPPQSPDAVVVHPPGVDPNYVAHAASDAAPAVSMLVWAARRGHRANRLAGFRHWAVANAPGEHTVDGWDAHFAKFSSTPVL